MTSYRVAVLGPGDAGHYAIRGCITHPDLELVGVRAFSASKIGRDAAELVGWEAVGAPVVGSDGELLAREPDCLVYTGRSRTWEAALPYLAAGVNVAYLGITGLLHPATCDPSAREPLEAAAMAGNASIMYGGIDPGFTTQVLPLALSGISERVDHLTLYEVRDYDPLPRHRLEDFGFGAADPSGTRFATPGALERTWGSSVHALAEAMGVRIDGITEFLETEPAPETFDVPDMTIERGTIAAVRFGIDATVDGVERFRVEHVNRLRRDLAPEWPARQGYGVVIQGIPNYALHLDLEDPAGRQHRPALFGTAMFGVNAVPHLVAARPGIVSPLELGLVACRNVGGPHQDDNWTISRHIPG